MSRVQRESSILLLVPKISQAVVNITKSSVAVAICSPLALRFYLLIAFYSSFFVQVKQLRVFASPLLVVHYVRSFQKFLFCQQVQSLGLDFFKFLSAWSGISFYNHSPYFTVYGSRQRITEAKIFRFDCVCSDNKRIR